MRVDRFTGMVARVASLGWIALLSAACGGGGDGEGADTPRGGGSAIPKSGSSGQRDQARLCTAFEACGGDVIGSWEVAAVCFENAEVLLPAASDPECADSVREVTARAGGRYAFDAAGTQTTDLRIEIDFDTVWNDACVASLAGDDSVRAADICADLELGYEDEPEIAAASCELEGADCACLISSTELSEMASGAYEVADDMLGRSPFCVEGDTLRISTTAAGLTGVVVLQRM